VAQTALNKIIFNVNKEFTSVINPSSNPGFLLLPIALFVYILSNNFLGLFPYVFTASSHLTFRVSMALTLWLGHLLIAIKSSPQNLRAHLVPMGTPTALIPLMVLIELVRNLIRPLTLAVRLAANIIAGHLLLTLLARQNANSPTLTALTVLSALTILCTLEVAVRIIQAYVFSLLSTLYVNEVNSPIIN